MLQRDVMSEVMEVIQPMLGGTHKDKHGLNMSDPTDLAISLANEAVRQAMLEPVFKSYIEHKHSEYLHSKGWSKRRHFKDAVEIPDTAFWLLPMEIRDHPKELIKWVKRYHPYLCFKDYGGK